MGSKVAVKGDGTYTIEGSCRERFVEKFVPEDGGDERLGDGRRLSCSDLGHCVPAQDNCQPNIHSQEIARAREER